jgi:hypothetical protein
LPITGTVVPPGRKVVIENPVLGPPRTFKSCLVVAVGPVSPLLDSVGVGSGGLVAVTTIVTTSGVEVGLAASPPPPGRLHAKAASTITVRIAEKRFLTKAFFIAHSPYKYFTMTI